MKCGDCLREDLGPQCENKNDIVVSIICITYNHAPYIAKALDSFLMQKTRFPFEIIVHDDASTDGTAEIIQDYVQRYPNLIRPILQKKNIYSAGIKASKYIHPLIRGKYIAWCEGDDYWTDCEKLQFQVAYLEHNKNYIACCHQVQCHNMLSGEDKLFCSMRNDMDLSVADMIFWGWRDEGEGYKYIHINSIMYRSCVLKCLPPYLHKTWIVGDMPLCVFLASQGKFRYLNRVMSVYNMGVPGSYTDRKKLNDERERYYALENWVALYGAIDSDTNFQYHTPIQKVVLPIKKTLFRMWIKKHIPLVYPMYKFVKNILVRL